MSFVFFLKEASQASSEIMVGARTWRIPFDFLKNSDNLVEEHCGIKNAVWSVRPFSQIFQRWWKLEVDTDFCKVLSKVSC